MGNEVAAFWWKLSHGDPAEPAARRLADCLVAVNCFFPRRQMEHVADSLIPSVREHTNPAGKENMSEEINLNRRRFLGAAAMTFAAATRPGA
jgi:hypothetical protein